MSRESHIATFVSGVAVGFAAGVVAATPSARKTPAGGESGNDASNIAERYLGMMYSLSPLSDRLVAVVNKKFYLASVSDNMVKFTEVKSCLLGPGATMHLASAGNIPSGINTNPSIDREEYETGTSIALTNDKTQPVDITSLNPLPTDDSIFFITLSLPPTEDI